MIPQDYGKIVSKNLRRIASDHNKNQAEIARDLRINKATVSSWMNGTRVPRMSKIDMLARYFNCTRADIMEPYKPSVDDVRLSPEVIEVAKLLQQLKHDDLIEIRGEIKGILRSYPNTGMDDGKKFG